MKQRGTALSWAFLIFYLGVRDSVTEFGVGPESNTNSDAVMKRNQALAREEVQVKFVLNF